LVPKGGVPLIGLQRVTRKIQMLSTASYAVPVLSTILLVLTGIAEFSCSMLAAAVLTAGAAIASCVALKT
jgi:hypothetical protein